MFIYGIILGVVAFILTGISKSINNPAAKGVMSLLSGVFFLLAAVMFIANMFA